MKRIVLDASAVMALFDGRPGSEQVEDALALAVEGRIELCMSVVNWGEVIYSLLIERSTRDAERGEAELSQYPIELAPADAGAARLSAEMRARHRLPYADCFAAALAKMREATLVTSDPDFRRVEDQISILWIR